MPRVDNAGFPANIRLYENVLKTSFVLIFRRRLQDVLIKMNILTLIIRLKKTSWSRPIYWSWSYVFKASWKHFQNVFKTSSRHFQDVLPRRLENVFKTSCKNVFNKSSRHFDDVFKTFLSHLQDVLQRCLQDIFKTYHQVKLFLLTRLRDVFSKSLRRTAETVIYRRICVGHTSPKFIVNVQNL